MTVHIYGAGMAGLLAATMLRRLRPILHEAQPALPDNHGALLRFRTDAVARETGQTFRKVRVLKAVKAEGSLHDRSTIRDANLYSLKVTGSVAPRSVLDLTPCDRYIAPPDFLARMAEDIQELDIRFGDPYTGPTSLTHPTDVNISTIPMPALMKIMHWNPMPEFEFRGVWSFSATIALPTVDVYQTIYYPEPSATQYRASITGNRLIIEVAGDADEDPEFTQAQFNSILDDFGLWGAELHSETWKFHRFGKLLPVPDPDRHEFILAMTDQWRIYSLGRFATWRQILLDDVVEDVRWIEKMIMERSAYSRRLVGG